MTKLSLLLKLLEGETEQTLSSQIKLLHTGALPDLGSNIKCGNSVVGLDYFANGGGAGLSEDERNRLNAFDWADEFPAVLAAGGFDVVIGNPPYDVLEKDRNALSWPHASLSEYGRKQQRYKAALGGKLNLSRFFIIHALTLTRAGGRFGMIVPLAVLADISGANPRRALLEGCFDIEADCFPQKDSPNAGSFGAPNSRPES